MSIFTIYALGILVNINQISMITFLISAIFAIVALIVKSIEENVKIADYVTKVCSAIVIVSLLLAVITPAPKTAYMIIATHYVQTLGVDVVTKILGSETTINSEELTKHIEKLEK